ncbi:hypothetical protein BH24CHL4_BH24CHL4_11720 [soil metagenome]
MVCGQNATVIPAGVEAPPAVAAQGAVPDLEHGKQSRCILL